MMHRPRTALAVLGLAGSVCVLTAAWLTSAPTQTGPETTETPGIELEPALGQLGLHAFVDPETGELREPTREELARMATESPRRLSKSAGDIEIVQHPNGMRSAVLDERFMSTSVAKIGPDGEIVTDCFDSQAEVDAFLTGETPVQELEVR